MKNLLNSVVAIICIIFLQASLFGQATSDSSKSIVGTWDVVFESNYIRLSEPIFTSMKSKKLNGGNHNIAIYRFSEDDKIEVSSIRDYSNSDEKGHIIWKKDRSAFVRDVKYPKNISKRKREKGAKIKTKILNLDDLFLVLKSKGKVLYLRKMGKKI